MKGFLTWFKSNTKIKRWMFLILIGIILCCYGFSNVLVSKEIGFGDVAKIIAVFVIGFVFVIIGLIYIQKRTLEMVIEAEQDFENDEAVKLKSLIFNKNVYDKGPNVVVIGGGSGLNTVLKGLKNYTSNITAIVTISDYGREKTDSRKQLSMLPIDDVKGSFVSLASDEILMEKLLDYKFKSDRLKELNFVDIYMSAMQDIYGEFSESIEKSSNVLKITGKVLPVTLDEFAICAELKDGTVVEEKDKIAKTVYEKITKINRIYINPSNCKPAPGVIEAIENADAIIIGPGSLYTNVIPNLLVKGIARAIKESKAIKVYISNIMTQPGQTDNYSVSNHIDAIVDHVGNGIFDFCVTDTGEVIPEFIRKYNVLGADLVEQDTPKITQKEITVIKRDLSYVDGEYIRHNPDALASIIMELICTDLKYKDKQNDAQYLLVNSKLKEEKKNEKEREKTKKIKEKIEKKNEPKPDRSKRVSKFSEKYQERISSIKTSEQKTKMNKIAYEEAQRIDRTATRRRRSNKKK